MAVQNGTVMAFSVLYLPLVQAFGGRRGAVATVQSGVVLLGGLGGPLAGFVLDAWGPRRLFQGGAVLAGVGLLLASQARGLPELILAYGAVAGAGLSALSSVPNMVVVAEWFPERRGRAIALADLGTPIGTFLLVPLAQILVEASGWRTTLAGLAALLLLVVVPVNARQGWPGHHRAPTITRGEALREALRSGTFWALAALRFTAGIGFALTNTHAVAAATDAGVTPLGAATALGSVAVVSVAGRLLTGWLVDRLGPAPALTAAFGSGLLGLGGLALLVTTREPACLLGFVGGYGLAQGSSGIVATAAAMAAFRGPAIGMLTGWIALASGPGEALGAWVGGALHDLTGGYLSSFAVAAVAMGLAVGAAWQDSGRSGGSGGACLDTPRSR
jgi:MFS family permease